VGVSFYLRDEGRRREGLGGGDWPTAGEGQRGFTKKEGKLVEKGGEIGAFAARPCPKVVESKGAGCRYYREGGLGELLSLEPSAILQKVWPGERAGGYYERRQKKT